MGVAAHPDFGGAGRVKALGLRVPYIGRPASKELGLPNGQVNLGFTSRSANTSFLGNLKATQFAAMNKNPASFFDAPSCALRTVMRCAGMRKTVRQMDTLLREHRDLVEGFKKDMTRGVVHSTQGWLYMCCTDTLLDTGFDVRDIKADLPMVVWYAADDEDCPPKHGAWLVQHFKPKSRVLSGLGHVGGAFLDYPQFLEELLAAAAASGGSGGGGAGGAEG